MTVGQHRWSSWPVVHPHLHWLLSSEVCLLYLLVLLVLAHHPGCYHQAAVTSSLCWRCSGPVPKQLNRPAQPSVRNGWRRRRPESCCHLQPHRRPCEVCGHHHHHHHHQRHDCRRRCRRDSLRLWIPCLVVVQSLLLIQAQLLQLAPPVPLALQLRPWRAGGGSRFAHSLSLAWNGCRRLRKLWEMLSCVGRLNSRFCRRYSLSGLVSQEHNVM